MSRRFDRWTALCCTLLLAACASGSPEAAAPSAPAPASTAASAEASPAGTAAEGFYTTAQATQGMEIFGRACADCHALREVHGSDFMFEWEGSSVGRLYRVLSRTMPDDAPGSLPEEEYLSVVAYILQLNDFPAGSQPLTADTEALNAMKIAR